MHCGRQAKVAGCFFSATVPVRGKLSDCYADLRRNSSSFSLQPQLEQLRQQKSRTPTPAVMSTASRVPIENSECARECIGSTLSGKLWSRPRSHDVFPLHISTLVRGISFGRFTVANKCSTGLDALGTRTVATQVVLANWRIEGEYRRMGASHVHAFLSRFPQFAG